MSGDSCSPWAIMELKYLVCARDFNLSPEEVDEQDAERIEAWLYMYPKLLKKELGG